MSTATLVELAELYERSENPNAETPERVGPRRRRRPGLIAFRDELVPVASIEGHPLLLAIDASKAIHGPWNR